MLGIESSALALPFPHQRQHLQTSKDRKVSKASLPPSRLRLEARSGLRTCLPNCSVSSWKCRKAVRTKSMPRERKRRMRSATWRGVPMSLLLKPS